MMETVWTNYQARSSCFQHEHALCREKDTKVTPKIFYDLRLMFVPGSHGSNVLVAKTTEFILVLD